MHIGRTRLIKDGASNTKYDSKERLYRKYTCLNWSDSTKLEEALATDNNNKDEVEDLRAKSRWLKKEKLHQKQVVAAAKVKTCQQVAQNVANNQDACFSSLGAAFARLLAPSFSTCRATSNSPSNSGFVTLNSVTSTGFVTSTYFFTPTSPFTSFHCNASSPLFCFSLFSFLRLFGSGGIYHQDLNAHRNTIPIFLSPIQVLRSILLSLVDDYAV